MMGWIYMIVSLAAAAMLYGTGHRPELIAALIVLSISFATFCLMYELPMNRAKQRIAGQLASISSRGVHSEDFQRLQSMSVTPNADEKAFRWTPLSAMNMATGVAGAALLVWAIVVRVF